MQLLNTQQKLCGMKAWSRSCIITYETKNSSLDFFLRYFGLYFDLKLSNYAGYVSVKQSNY